MTDGHVPQFPASFTPPTKQQLDNLAAYMKTGADQHFVETVLGVIAEVRRLREAIDHFEVDHRYGTEIYWPGKGLEQE